MQIPRRAVTTLLISLTFGATTFPLVSFANPINDCSCCAHGTNAAIEIAKINATAQMVAAFVPEFSKRQKGDNNLDQSQAKYVELIKAVRAAMDSLEKK
jgi:hypothetical protein